MSLPSGILALGCPISTTAFGGLESLPRIQDAFARTHEKRLEGSPVGLEAHANDLRARIVELRPRMKAVPADKAVRREKLLYEAALGECWSLLGRWKGEVATLRKGVARLERFATAVDGLGLDTNGGSYVRAHAAVGNALTRLGYVTHDPGTLRKAVSALKTPAEEARERFPALSAVIFRDLGDAYIGQAHWDPESVLDGAGEEWLKRASKGFLRSAEEETADLAHRDRMFDEWAAAQSSLAVVLAKAAQCLLKDTDVAKPYLTHHSEGRTETVSREQKSAILIEEAKSIIKRVWRIYVGKVNGVIRPSFRWARTISNLAFASSYIYEVDESEESGALAEVAFLSVTGGGKEPLFFGKTSETLGCGELLSEPKARSYNGDDHRYRYLVNRSGLGDHYWEIAQRQKTASRARSAARRAQEQYLSAYSRAEQWESVSDDECKERITEHADLRLDKILEVYPDLTSSDKLCDERGLSKGQGSKDIRQQQNKDLESARERLLATRESALELKFSAAADVQILIDCAKVNLPMGEEARKAFVAEVNSELKRYGLVLIIDGEERTSLTMHKGSIASSTDRGPRGFLRKPIKVVPRRDIESINSTPEQHRA